jgi:hypothetical protein
MTLPARGYTAVWVPLRHVTAGAPIYEQIQQALDQATHRRVDWWQLVEQGKDRVRVVLLDGLDELVQASSGHHGTYLLDVVEFQRREAEQGRPVAVVVTSRTVVVDRVEIPANTTVVKLEDFNRPRIESWLAEWHRANSRAIEVGTVRPLAMETALARTELSSQPLLLLLLAMYVADPNTPAISEDVSPAGLYDRLLTTFAYRECTKSPTRLPQHKVDEAVQDHLHRLAIAALAMFNRGRQDVTDVELGTDLGALGAPHVDTDRPEDRGRDVAGQFFFIHTAQAHRVGSAQPQQSYEFMHATFGEYLVARHVVDAVVDMSNAARSRRRSSRSDPDDDLLCALLCHQVLVTRRNCLDFVENLFDDLDPRERSHITGVLETLIRGYRGRHGSARYAEYRPTPVDHVHRLATYSANLVLLRLAVGEPLSINNLWPARERAEWGSNVELWKSGLYEDNGRRFF